MRNIISDVIFKNSVRDETIEGDNPYKCEDKGIKSIIERKL